MKSKDTWKGGEETEAQLMKAETGLGMAGRLTGEQSLTVSGWQTKLKRGNFVIHKSDLANGQLVIKIISSHRV